MAVTRIIELNAFPLPSVSYDEERHKPVLFVAGRNNAVGDATAGAVTFKFRGTNYRNKYGNLYYILNLWRLLAADSVAANMTVKAPYVNYEQFILLGADAELFFGAGLDSGAQVTAPDPSIPTIKRYLGRLYESYDDIEVQLITSVNTNGTAYLAYVELLGFVRRPITLGMNIQ